MGGPNGTLILPSSDIEYSISEEEKECPYCFAIDGDCGCFEEAEEGGESEECEDSDSDEDYETSSENEFSKPYDENYAEDIGCKRYVYLP